MAVVGATTENVDIISVLLSNITTLMLQLCSAIGKN